MPIIKNGNKKEEIVEEIKKHIAAGNRIINKFNLDRDTISFKTGFNTWRNNTIKSLNDIFSDNSILNQFSMETVIFINKFSQQNTINTLNEGFEKGMNFLKILRSDICKGLYDEAENLNKDEAIDKTIALIIIRRILNNFHKHIQAMYQEKVHGNGTIKQEDLRKIRIGNEYDVQRILYSLIRPIFPEVRLEVSDDAGYKSVRYDVILEEYSIVIEVKCSRKSMSERNLTEELGSDAFHYKGEYLFLFIFDKENIIKNTDAFENAYKREKGNFDKDIEAIVIQPVTI
ncbi:hypothetical protein [Clostridium sp. ZS2-4]|uniref:PD-(D/E)XK nuclease domain-containing protein n=1 Tax=Clostridium sp. ZS2-4 TaxID=2987703 RepID=UPI00227CBD38|nr:hypothetical protein [Clostridium sp. ZS2-4]MCY6355288.1 hypothetical protein [Clostridium sp. ZS2-4]